MTLVVIFLAGYAALLLGMWAVFNINPPEPQRPEGR
jgi:hypothetical protein